MLGKPGVPQSLPLEVPSIRDVRSSQGIVMTTNFFRADAHIDQAVEMLTDRVEVDETAVILSAGCSSGAELLSAVTLYKFLRPESEVEGYGYDFNELAISEAKAGQYIAQRGLAKMAERALAMRGLGFDMAKVTGHDGQDDWEIDALPVHDEIPLTYMVHDLRNKFPLPLANLVLMNNVLFHVNEVELPEMVGNAGEALAVGGLLSLGDTGAINESRKQVIRSTLHEVGVRPIIATRGMVFERPDQRL